MESPNQDTLSKPPSSGRPSLLKPGSPAGAGEHAPTRMLASLARDGVHRSTPETRPARPRGRFVVAALMVVAAVSVASFVSLDRTGDAAAGNRVDAQAQRAAAPVATTGTGLAAAEDAGRSLRPSAGAGAAAVTGAVAAASAARSPLAAATATPSASAAIESAAAAMPTMPAVAAVGQAASAPSPSSDPLARLALDDAASPPNPAASVRPAARKAPSKGAAGKSSQGNRSASAKPGEARAEAFSTWKARTGEEDPDTELVAAVIARLDRRGATPPHPTIEADSTLVARVRECDSKTDLLDARRCRNRACDGRWGKVDACPSARAPRVLSGAGIDHDKAF